MTNYVAIQKKYEELLTKTYQHFSYSFAQVSKLPQNIEKLTDSELVEWESFSSRFARFVDIFLTKFLRAYVQKEDPGFKGTLLDFLNRGEKMGLIDSAQRWMQLRELRNLEAHTYEENLGNFFLTLMNASHEIHQVMIKIQKQVRLSKKEWDGIMEIFKPYSQHPLYLVGSRVDLRSQGGDIDLLLVCHNENELNQIHTSRPQLLSELKQLIGDQKVDLTISTKEKINQDPILQSMLLNSKPLNTFNP